MTSWLLKTLWLQKFSLLTSGLGIAAALLLVVIMDAAFIGESNQIVAYIRHASPDIWVMQKGVSNMHMATSYVQDWKAERIASIPGVRRATSILYINTIVHARGRRLFAYVIGLHPDGQRAGPWSMASGRSQPGQGEIVLPEVLADMAELELGDEAIIADKHFRVTGFSRGTFSMANSIAFVSYTDVASLISTGDAISFVLVDADEGIDTNKLAASIMEQVEKVNVVTQQQFIRNDFQIAKLMGVEIISFMTFISTVLATLIVAFATYTQVSRRRRELAIIKALGFENVSLYTAALLQSIIITAIALLLSLIGSLVLAPLLSALVPMINLDVTMESLVRTGGIAAVAAILAALVPAYLVGRVDPASAFKV